MIQNVLLDMSLVADGGRESVEGRPGGAQLGNDVTGSPSVVTRSEGRRIVGTEVGTRAEGANPGGERQQLRRPGIPRNTYCAKMSRIFL